MDSRTKSHKKSSWPRIHTRKLPSGQPVWIIDVRVAGKRIFRRYTTAQDAEDFAAGLRSQRQKEGQAAFSITAPLRVEAAECAELLAPHGATIREACKWYERHVLKYRNAPIINEIVDKLIADAVAAGRRDKTVADLHYRLGAVVKTFGKRKLSEITVEELQAWSNNPSLSAQSRRHMLTKLSQLYRYAERRGWSEKNIVPYLNRPDVEDGEPGFLAVDDCARLLKHAPDFNLLPYIALSLFCGIRVAELRRLTWGKVKIVERVILIDGAVAKTKARRVIEINDTALAWLATCAKNSGLVVDPANFRKRLDALRKAAKLVKDWPDNALRHTAATYAYALTQDAVRVSGMLGNSPDVLHRHYRGLATKHEAEQFFALRPTADTAEKIKTMKVVNS